MRGMLGAMLDGTPPRGINPITRRAMLVGALSLATLALPVFAQRAAPVRIGWLAYIGEPDPGLQMLREGLRDLGYSEGKTHVMVARYADGDFTRLPELVAELIGRKNRRARFARPVGGLYKVHTRAGTGRVCVQRRSDHSGIRRQPS